MRVSLVIGQFYVSNVEIDVIPKRINHLRKIAAFTQNPFEGKIKNTIIT